VNKKISLALWIAAPVVFTLLVALIVITVWNNQEGELYGTWINVGSDFQYTFTVNAEGDNIGWRGVEGRGFQVFMWYLQSDTNRLLFVFQDGSPREVYDIELRRNTFILRDGTVPGTFRYRRVSP